MLTFHFTGPKGEMTVPEILTSGMIGKQVRFTFSSDWDGFRKTVTFLASGGPDPKFCLVELNGDTATIPAQILASPEHTLYVTVHGYSPDGKQVIPSLRTPGPRILPGENLEDLPQVDPENPIWHQVLGQMGDLSTLVTEHQDTLVGAINEVSAALDTVEHGYYLPDVTQVDQNTARVSFTPSHDFLEPVEDATLSLPAGPKGDSVCDVMLQYLKEDTANQEDLYQLDVYISSGTAAQVVNAGTIRVRQGSDGASIYDVKLMALPESEDGLTDTYQLDVYISTGTATQVVSAGTIQVKHGKDGAPGTDGKHGYGIHYTDLYMDTETRTFSVADLFTWDRIVQENDFVLCKTNGNLFRVTENNAGILSLSFELCILGAGEQPDWAQNDPEASDYVQNRTHWVVDRETVLDQTAMTKTDVPAGWVWTPEASLWAMTSPMTKIPLQVGTEYTVDYNGTVYTTLGKEFVYGDMHAGVALGNAETFAGAGDSGEPFVFVYVYPDMAEAFGGAYGAIADMTGAEFVSMSVSVRGQSVHKLPGKFLPEGVGYVGDMEVTTIVDTRTDAESGALAASSALSVGANAILYVDGAQVLTDTVKDGGVVNGLRMTYIGNAGSWMFATLISETAAVPADIIIPDGAYADRQVRVIQKGKKFVQSDERCLPDSVKNLIALGIPAYTGADEGKVLGVVDGALAWVDRA